MYHIAVKNPKGVQRGGTRITADGRAVEKLPVPALGGVCHAEVEMGEQK